MKVELETINKLFLELSQFATAQTCRELELENGIRTAMMHLKTNYDIDGNSMEDSDAYTELHKALTMNKCKRIINRYREVLHEPNKR